jgi:hypothetical protein
VGLNLIHARINFLHPILVQNDNKKKNIGSQMGHTDKKYLSKINIHIDIFDTTICKTDNVTLLPECKTCLRTGSA